MIAVIDYGAGNLRSVANTLEAIGAEYTVVTTPERLVQASKIVLPGVGHFGQIMRALDELKLRDVLKERIEKGVPFLGICLGLHALFERSAEAPEERGLGVFAGSIERFTGDRRIPHMGWNSVKPRANSRLFAGFEREPYFYFAHSYYLPSSDLDAAQCSYGLPFCAAIEQGNVFGVQFHPEKSAGDGQRVVSNFSKI